MGYEFLPGGQILKASRLGDSVLTQSVVVERELPLTKHRSVHVGADKKLGEAGKGTRRMKLQNGEIYTLKPDEKIPEVLARYRERLGSMPTPVPDFKKKVTA